MNTEIGPTTDQRRILEKYRVDKKRYEGVPQPEIKYLILRLFGEMKHRNAGKDNWGPSREKTVEKLGLAPGRRVFIKKHGQCWIETVVERITPDFKVICRGFKEPIRPTKIEPIP